MKRLLARWLRKDEGPAHLVSGTWGEKQAERFLKKQGYKILGRRVRVGRRDELDLVARHDDALVFVEVKTRRSVAHGRPIEAVNRAKRLHLSRAAIRYMKELRQKPTFFRFDVVEVVGEPGAGVPDIRLIRNAFPLDKRYRFPWS